jgi:tetratricopeptide (TPR) repeat protein
VTLTDRHRLLFGSALVLLILVAYARVPAAGFIWDDDEYVADNRNLDDVEGLRRIWLDPGASPQYYPLVFTTFWLERRVFGLDPRAAHLVNIALHAVNALLLWAVLRRLALPGAYVAALVFALHPVHVESVAWITERKNVLSGAFYLASALAYLPFALPDGASRSRTRLAVRYGAALLLFLFALLSKTVTATLPLALIVVTWAARGRVTRTDIARMAPLLVLGAAMGLSTAWLEMHHVGALGEPWQLSPVERLLLAGRAAWFYARSLVWPHPLMFIYPRWSIDPRNVMDYVPLAGVAAVLAAAWWARRSVGRWPVAGVTFFLVALFPALGFFNVYPMRYSWVADHFQYLASIGVIAGAIGVLSRLAAATRRPAIALAGAAGIVATLLPATHHATLKYRDAETLWLDTIAKNDSAWIAYNNLGNIRVSQGRYAEARALLANAVRLKPDLAEAHNNLGTALLHEGDVARAIDHHTRAVALNPAYAEAHSNLGVDHARLGRFPEALDHYARALRIDPGYAMAHYNLANLLVRLNRSAEAEEHYRQAVRIRNDLGMARFQLGRLLLDRGRWDEAEDHLTAAFQQMPAFARGYYEVANSLLRQGRAGDAIAYYARALGADPDYAEAHCNLGSALMQLGRRAEAVERYRTALRLQPRYALAANNLGFALESLGRVDEALDHYQAALEMDPAYAKASENLQRLRAARVLRSR